MNVGRGPSPQDEKPNPFIEEKGSGKSKRHPLQAPQAGGMARERSIAYAGAIYHAIARGNRRFYDPRPGWDKD